MYQGVNAVVGFGKDSSQLACACDDGNIYIVDANTSERLQTLKGHTGVTTI